MHVHVCEAGGGEPIELIEETRGLVHWVGVAIEIPTVAREEVVGGEVAVECERAATHGGVPSAGGALSPARVRRLDDIRDDEHAARREQCIHVAEQRLLLCA